MLTYVDQTRCLSATNPTVSHWSYFIAGAAPEIAGGGSGRIDDLVYNSNFTVGLWMFSLDISYRIYLSFYLYTVYVYAYIYIYIHSYILLIDEFTLTYGNRWVYKPTDLTFGVFYLVAILEITGSTLCKPPSVSAQHPMSCWLNKTLPSCPEY